MKNSKASQGTPTAPGARAAACLLATFNFPVRCVTSGLWGGKRENLGLGFLSHDFISLCSARRLQGSLEGAVKSYQGHSVLRKLGLSKGQG